MGTGRLRVCPIRLHQADDRAERAARAERARERAARGSIETTRAPHFSSEHDPFAPRQSTWAKFVQHVGTPPGAQQ
jgi:hypothetical protein